MKHYSTKTYTHAEGLSACFRQWRANSHCSFLHGYALQVAFTFGAQTLDDKHWVMDFGGLKGLRGWLHDTFDHKTLVAEDDPEIGTLLDLHERRVIDIVVLPAVGCEKFAEYIFNEASQHLPARVWIESVEVREHGGNSALVRR